MNKEIDWIYVGRGEQPKTDKQYIDEHKDIEKLKSFAHKQLTSIQYLVTKLKEKEEILDKIREMLE